MVFTFRNRLKIIIQQSMPATSNISNMGYFKINITVILTILLFLILKMMRFLLANHSLIISLCTVCLFQLCGQWKCFEDYRNTCIEDFFHEIYLSSIFFLLDFTYYELTDDFKYCKKTQIFTTVLHVDLLVYTWQHLWWCDLFPAQVLQHS